MLMFEKLLTEFQARAEHRAKRTDEFADGIAWIENEFVPVRQARIPILDQGFLHSDLTYDVPAVWNGRIFRLDDHLDRLETSCAKMRLPLPMARPELRSLVIDLISRSGLQDAYVEIIVTRGLKFLRGAQAEDIVPNLYLMAVPYVWILPLEYQHHGAPAVVTRTVRRTPPGALDPTIKNLQWGDLVRGLMEAGDRDAFFPILPDGDGNATEGAGYNIVLVRNGELYTPRRGVLEGITRRTVLEIASARGLKTHVTEIPVQALYECDELFMCSTAGGIMPLVLLDGNIVGEGTVGPVTRMIWEAYWDLHDDPRFSEPVTYAR